VLQRLTTWIWYAIVLLIVLLAVYSSLGRLLLGNLGQYREDILREVNARIDFVLEIDEVRGSWRSLSPRIEASGVRILGDRHAPVGLSFEEVSLELDVFDTLRTLSPRLFTLNARGGRIHVDIDENGELRLAGMPGSGQANLGPTLNDFIFNAESLILDEMAVELHDASQQRVSFVEAELQRDGAFRRFLLSLRAPDRQSWFRLTAEGRGELSDFKRFEGLFHLQSTVGQLALYEDLLAAADLKPGAGVIESDLWLALDRGAIQVAANVNGQGIQLESLSQDYQPILIQQATGTAAANYVEGSWEFRARDINLAGSGETIAIDRLVGRYGDNRLTLRMADLRLGELASYLERAGLLPDSAAAVLGKLSPRGRLERVEFALSDLGDLEQWRLSTNFSNLDVNPWKGAPGLTNAAGFANLDSTGGSVQLASSDFSMSFPTVFRDPLDYSSFRAELDWSVDEDAFRIRSGPFTAFAEEGEVRGLFALKLPRIEMPTGSEMDLLVALRDTSPQYRSKYLPYKLNRNLLNWLEPSIGAGAISEGGFVYRGSLVRRPEHRTVQLFFDIEDTRIDYHPDWPALQELEGLVLINDSNVDVYGKRGRVLGSEVSDIRAHIRAGVDKKLHLDLQAAMRGGAADGLTIVNQSPLRSRVGDTFQDWTLEGGLATRLTLSMSLSDLSLTPDVALWMDFEDVDVTLGALNLEATEVNGALRYRTETGFISEAVTGRLWGEAISGTVSQGRRDGELADLDIALEGPVSTASLRDWLGLDVLRLAEGRTVAELHVLVPPGGGPRIAVESGLEGVALDLPGIWAKAAEEPRTTTLSMPLASGARRLDIVMDQRAFLSIDLDEQGFSGGALGFTSALEPPGPGRFLIGGATEALDWSAWERFIDTYLALGEAREVPVRTDIRDLEIGTLGLFGQTVESVLLSGRELEDAWHFDFATDWIVGGVDIPDDLSLVNIDLKSLDVDALGRHLDLADGDVTREGDGLPPLSINISNLYRGDHSWGNLSFQLRQDGTNLHFREVRGNLRNLQLGSEQGMQLDWTRGGDGDRTRLAGTLGFLNFGDVLADYQYEEIVETNSGRVEVDLDWPGAPTDYRLQSLHGSLGIDVEEGRFLKTSGAAEGTLRVVGILNLTEFVRRLSLDLSHVYKAGVPFDSIEGELFFNDGTIEVPSMDVRGRTSRFQFVGVADALDSTVEGELVATLPLASNLPWMFALVSGLPAAAGVYVISKLFNKQMDRFSSAVYSVSGPWSDPQVNFERIFDDSAKDDIIQTAESAEAGEVAAETEEPET
jgi:uncharacterized protein (TIGR02099 family)